MALTCKRAPVNMFGVRVHIAPGALPAADTAAALSKHHMRRATSFWEADLFVVSDVSSAQFGVVWTAVLGGRTIASCEFFKSGGKHGACISHDSPLSTRRLIWISPSFIRERRPLVANELCVDQCRELMLNL